MNSDKVTNIDNKLLNSSLECQEYYLIKENKVYRFIIYKRKIDIIIKCKNYEIKINNNNIKKLYTKSFFSSNDDLYKYIINSFEKNEIIINEIVPNEVIKLKINKKELELNLKYNKENKNSLFNEFNYFYIEYKNEINDLKDEIKMLKKEIRKLKSCNNNNNKPEIEKNEINLIKENRVSKELTKDSYSQFALDNSFTVFKSINDILHLIYTNNDKSIVSYNLLDNKKILEIKNAHESYITNFRHILDKINNRDLMMSISGEDNNIKLWDVNNYQCLLDIKKINNSGFLDSACFFNFNKQIYIITSNANYVCSELIKIFDFNGEKVNEINNSNDITVFIDTYYDKKFSKNYILTGNYGYVKSYDYDENKLYHKYCDNNSKSHDSIVININEDLIKLIESSEDGNIRIWNFHSGILLNKIKINNRSIYGICLWNNEYLFVGCRDKAIKLVEIKSGKIIKNYFGDNNYALTIKKVTLPKLGECLISQGWKNEQIKIWVKLAN